MKIKVVLKHIIAPFELKDGRTKKIFSYFLHLAPFIKSKCSCENNKDKEKIWEEFLGECLNDNDKFYIYHPQSDINYKKYELDESSQIKNRCNRFVIKLATAKESNIECLLRHIRNSLAHCNVYMYGKRIKYFIFDDYTTKGIQNARILFTLSTLKKLKTILTDKKK